ncbi:uncharacterized protein TOT_010001263 [Theileria orientalis strain Shintoku]|uniref:Zinc finger PHD-type domain-containing protein n=1 Tax=Theileria orientalis strain Shintoku TaxID=869250 RepID=J4C2N3_THEOR|nr:uncharacterized protein TOT_010001263 [Theileria orientalis strain Shintoku]BAM38991.1 uncharacterized protein TOT_010001263 [Theileria orientalis strain Shintoku]|eukprot:XP_009689292.1 uncharacterized protein TOT_010001263 [Theileria orientalis strain Shintoku]
MECKEINGIDMTRLSTMDSLKTTRYEESDYRDHEDKYLLLLEKIRRRGFEPKTLGEVLKSRNKKWAKTQCIHASAKEDFIRHLQMYKNQFKSYNKTPDGWIAKDYHETYMTSKTKSRSTSVKERTTSMRNEGMVWSSIIFCPNFRPGGEIVHRYSRRTEKTYNTLYKTIKDGWVHPNLLVCLIRDATHPVRFATPPDQDCYTAIYTGPEISESMNTKVIFGEYTGIVYREDSIPDSIFEYAFELNFTSASWVDAELEYRNDKQYIRDMNGTIFLPNNSKYVLDSSHAFNELSMVNHCQSIGAYGGEYFLQANCEWQQVIFDGWPHVILTNKQGVKIQTGDELIADFGALWFQKVEENCHRQLKRELIQYRLLHSNLKPTVTYEAYGPGKGTYNTHANNHSAYNDYAGFNHGSGSSHNGNPYVSNRAVNGMDKARFELLRQELPVDKSLDDLDVCVVNNNTSYVCAICLDEDLNVNPNTSTKKLLQQRAPPNASNMANKEEMGYRDDEDEDECIVCDGCDRIFHTKCLQDVTSTAMNYIQMDVYGAKFIDFNTYLKTGSGGPGEKVAAGIGGKLDLSLRKWYCMYCRYLCKQIIQHDLNQDFMPLQSCIYVSSNAPATAGGKAPSSAEGSTGLEEASGLNRADMADVTTTTTSSSSSGDSANEDNDIDMDAANSEKLLNLNKITNYINKLTSFNLSNNYDDVDLESVGTCVNNDLGDSRSGNQMNIDDEGVEVECVRSNEAEEGEKKKKEKNKMYKRKDNVFGRYAKRRKKRVQVIKKKSTLFKGNSIKTMHRMKLVNKPTTLEIAKHLIKQKILSLTSDRVNIGQIRLFGNYTNYGCNFGKINAKIKNLFNINLYRDNCRKQQYSYRDDGSEHSYKDGATTYRDGSPRYADGSATYREGSAGYREASRYGDGSRVYRDVSTGYREVSPRPGGPPAYRSEGVACKLVDPFQKKGEGQLNKYRSDQTSRYSNYSYSSGHDYYKGYGMVTDRDSWGSQSQVHSVLQAQTQSYAPTYSVPQGQQQQYSRTHRETDSSVVGNVVDYLNCRYLAGMWQLEPFAIFGEAVRVCVECNRKCGPKANVYVCRILKRHLGGNFDHPKATNVEQMRELILIAYEQHVSYLLRLLVLKNVTIDFLVKLALHFITQPFCKNQQSPASVSTAGGVATPNNGNGNKVESLSTSVNMKGDLRHCNEDSTANGTNAGKSAASSNVKNDDDAAVSGNNVAPLTNSLMSTTSVPVNLNEMSKKERREYMKNYRKERRNKEMLSVQVSEFVRAIAYNMRRVPNGDGTFNYALLETLGGLEKDFVRLVDCGDICSYINDLASYMCFSNDQVPSNIQQILSREELSRFAHFRRHLMKEPGFFGNDVSGANTNASSDYNDPFPTPQYNDPGTASQGSSASKSDSSESGKRPKEEDDFVPLLGIRPGRSVLYRKFSDGYYQGIVSTYGNSSYFKIEYSDGDDELMDPLDLLNELVGNLNNIKSVLLQLSSNDIRNYQYLLLLRGHNVNSAAGKDRLEELCTQLRNYMLNQLVHNKVGSRKYKKRS